MLTFDKTIMKYDSDSIIFNTDDDLTGWDLKYLAKKSLSDKDDDAVLDIEPQLVTVGTQKKIYIPIDIDDLKDLSIGTTYYHALKISKYDSGAHTLMCGKLTISEAYIQYPEELN